MLFPIGSDLERSRFPRFTLTIIIICALIHPLATWHFALKGGVPQSLATEMHQVEFQLMIRYFEKRPDLIKHQDPERYYHFVRHNHPTHYRHYQTEMKKELEAGELVPHDSELYRKWAELNDEIVRERRERDIYYILGHKGGITTPITLLTHMFMHGGFGHLFFNMYFLWIMGIGLEDVWGRKVYAAIYFLGGIVAALTHQLLSINPEIPLIGASGAISALMGAFMIRFRKNRLRFAFFTLMFWLPAWIPILFWLARDLIYAISGVGELGGVAVWAHVGGYAAGISFALLLQRFKAEDTVIAGFLAEQDRKDREKAEQKAEKKAPPVRMPEIEQGIEARKFERYDEARSWFKAALEKDPDNLEAREELCRISLKLGDDEAAAADIGGIIEVLLKKNQVDPALAWYGEFLKIGANTKAAGPWTYRIATELQKRGSYDHAIYAFYRYASLCAKEPLAPKAMFVAAQLLAEKTGNLPKALELLDRLKIAFPEWMPEEVAAYQARLSGRTSGP